MEACIEDISKAISAIREYTRGLDFDAFAKDRKTVDAVVRNLIIIGEAAESRDPEATPRVLLSVVLPPVSLSSMTA